METIWAQLSHQVIQQVYEIKPHFWVFSMRAKTKGFLLLNFHNEHPTFSIQDKQESNILTSFSEAGLSEKLNGFHINEVKIAEDRSVMLSLVSETQRYSLKFQLAPYAPRFQLIQFEEIIYDSILGWQPKVKIKSKSSSLVLDNSLNLDWILRYSYSLDYLQIIQKTITRKKKREEALKEDLRNHIKCLGYQTIAEAIQSLPNQAWQDYPNPNQLPPPKLNFKTNFSGTNELFKLYKKAKKGINLVQLQLELNQSFMDTIQPFSVMVPPLTSQDLASLKSFLENEHLLSGMERKPREVLHHSPYYVEYKGVRISYGKNAKQNHQLTFSIAKKSDIFMHIEGKPGSHLIIHHSQFDRDLIIRGAQVILALANQISGTITYAKVGSLKQTKTLGLVLIKDSKTIKANADPEFINKLLENSKRY